MYLHRSTWPYAHVHAQVYVHVCVWGGGYMSTPAYTCAFMGMRVFKKEEMIAEQMGNKSYKPERNMSRETADWSSWRHGKGKATIGRFGEPRERGGSGGWLWRGTVPASSLHPPPICYHPLVPTFVFPSITFLLFVRSACSPSLPSFLLLSPPIFLFSSSSLYPFHRKYCFSHSSPFNISFLVYLYTRRFAISTIALFTLCFFQIIILLVLISSTSC